MTQILSQTSDSDRNQVHEDLTGVIRTNLRNIKELQECDARSDTESTLQACMELSESGNQGAAMLCMMEISKLVMRLSERMKRIDNELEKRKVIRQLEEEKRVMLESLNICEQAKKNLDAVEEEQLLPVGEEEFERDDFDHQWEEI